MRIATWNLCHNRGASVWPSLWNALNLDIIFLQETALPETNNSFHWELVDGNEWGSAVILNSGRIEPIEIPNYRGWVAGGEVHDSRLQTENRRLFVFSLHSPTSNPGNKRLPEQPQPPLAATRRHDVATGVSPWIMKTRCAGLAATRRHDVAMGVSPWVRETHRAASPEGTTCGEPIDGPVAPLGLGNRGRFVDHGLAPMATTCRPFGT